MAAFGELVELGFSYRFLLVLDVASLSFLEYVLVMYLGCTFVFF